MMKGTLWKSTSSYVGSMEKRYCVLVGTLVLDFESEEDFLSGVPPKAEGEVIGVSVWKAKAWPRGAHTEGFVYVTRLGHTNYCAVPSKRDQHDEWMLWMRTALDMALGTDGVGPPPAAGGVAISREALQRGVLEPPKPAESEVCMKSGVAFGMTQSRHHCTSCGRVFALEHCNRRVPLPHHGFEEAVRVCDDCLAAQQHLTHLRYLCCTLDAHLHEQRRANRGVRTAVMRRLGRVSEGGASGRTLLDSSLKVGLDLLEKGELSEEEFSGLVKAQEGFQKDEAYNRVHAGCLAASSRLGDSTLAVVGLLHRGAAAAPSGEFRAVVMHLRMLAAKDLDSIDFFWPQVLHAFYLLVPTVTAEGVFKAELLEDFILAMALRSTHLALKLVWWLKGYVEDLAVESAAPLGKGATGKQAHLIRLAVEVEDIVLARADEANSISSVSSRQNRRRSRHDDQHARSEEGCSCCDSGADATTTTTGGGKAAGAGAMAASAEEAQQQQQPGAAAGATAAEAAGDRQEDSPPESMRAEAGKPSPARPDESAGAGGAVAAPKTAGSDETGRRRRRRCSCSNDGDVGGPAGSSGTSGGGGGEASSPLPFERRLLTTLLRPTGAQSSLVGDELLLLRALRAAAAEQLGLDYEAKTRYTSWAGGGGAGEEEGEEEEEEEAERGESEARYFEDQLTFVQALVDIAERLRFVEPISSRGEHLKRELRKLEGDGAEEEAEKAAGEDTQARSGDGKGSSSSSSGSSNGDGGNYGAAGGPAAGGIKEVPGSSSPLPEVAANGSVEADAAATAAAARNSDAHHGGGVTTPAPPGNSRGKEGEGDAAGDAAAGRRLRSRRRSRQGGGGATRGFLPVCRATDPICPIVRIPPEEGHVFKTKQRAPTLITCEIVVPPGGGRRRRRRREDGGGDQRGWENGHVAGSDSSSLPPSSPPPPGGLSPATGTASVSPGGFGGGGGSGSGSGSGAKDPGGVDGSGDGGGLPLNRARSVPLQRKVSRKGSGLMPRGARGGDGDTASPLHLLRRETSRGSDREEVEEIIGTQVEGQGSLGRSIDNKDPGGVGSSDALLPPAPPGGAGAGGHRVSPPLPPNFRQRAHSDPPFVSPISTRNGSGGGGGAAQKRCSTPSGTSCPPAEPRPAGVAARGEPSTAAENGAPIAAATTPAAVAAAAEGAATPEVSEGGGRGPGDDGALPLPLPPDATVYPEVLSALGLGPGSEPAVAVAASSGPEQEPEAGADSVGGGAGAGRGGRKSERAGGSTSSSMRVSLTEQDLVLPEPVREEGPTGDQQASDVADLLLRSHHGHELLRHSPLNKGGGGGGGGDGARAARPWGDVAATNNGDASAGGEEEGGDHAGRESGSALSSGGGGAENTGSTGKSIIDAAGSSPTAAAAVAAGDTGGLTGNPRPGDIEREVRQQGGGVRAGDSGAAGARPEEGREGEGGGGGEESLAVSQARALLLQGLISEEELEAVVKKDQAFTEVVEQHAFLDVQFCVSQAFGESWAGKRARIKAASAEGSEEGWDLVSIIVKSNDDMRQEVCALQLIGLCQRIFAEAQLDLFLQPYVIVSTGSSSGLVQCLTDAISVDALKKNPGFVSLRDHFERTYGEPTSKRFLEAQRNFVNSLAAYSLAAYVLQIKDRHNGNILLDTEGRLIHIDFGFILGMAPGGNFALETCPFKLPTEYVDVMGGLESQAFMDLVVAFTCGFLTLQAHGGRLVKLLGMMTQKSPFPCFQGKDPPERIVEKLSERLMPHLDKSETVAFCLDLIRESYNNYGQRQFDYYQWLTNGIVA